MPVYRLDDRLVFPPPDRGPRRGPIAVGGDLRPERLLLAYSMGIFP
jgi:leucyl/phenylalanyl-tRNA--protein transferase